MGVTLTICARTRVITQPFCVTKEVGRGTGFGLSLSEGSVEDHGGRLRLEPGSPTTFAVVVFLRQENDARSVSEILAGTQVGAERADSAMRVRAEV